MTVTPTPTTPTVPATPAAAFPYRMPRTQRFFILLDTLLAACANHGQIDTSLIGGIWKKEIDQAKTTGRPSPQFKATLEAWLDPTTYDPSRQGARPAVQELYDTLYPA